MTEPFGLQFEYDQEGAQALLATQQALAGSIAKLTENIEKMCEKAGEGEDANDDFGDSSDRAGKSAKGAGASFVVTAKQALELAGKLLGAAKAATAFAFEFGKLGAQARDIDVAWKRLGRSGQDLARLQAATARTIDATTLQTFDLLNQELGLTVEQIENVGKASTQASVLFPQVGSSAEIMTAALEGNLETLKRAGIVINEADKRYQGLSETGKKVAFAQEVAARGAMVNVDALDSQGLAYAQAEAKLADFTSDLQVFAADVIVQSGLIDSLQGGLGELGHIFEENKDLIRDVVKVGFTVLTESLEKMLLVVDKLAKAYRRMEEAVLKATTGAMRGFRTELEKQQELIQSQGTAVGATDEQRALAFNQAFVRAQAATNPGFAVLQRDIAAEQSRLDRLAAANALGARASSGGTDPVERALGLLGTQEGFANNNAFARGAAFGAGGVPEQTQRGQGLVGSLASGAGVGQGGGAFVAELEALGDILGTGVFGSLGTIADDLGDIAVVMGEAASPFTEGGVRGFASEIDLIGDSFSALEFALDESASGIEGHMARLPSAFAAAANSVRLNTDKISASFKAFGDGADNELEAVTSLASAGISAASSFASAFTDDIKIIAGFKAAENFAAALESAARFNFFSAGLHTASGVQYSLVAAGAIKSGGAGGSAGAGAGAGGPLSQSFSPSLPDNRRDRDDLLETLIVQLQVDGRLLGEEAARGLNQSARIFRNGPALSRGTVRQGAGVAFP